jgi:hypothetical protein
MRRITFQIKVPLLFLLMGMIVLLGCQASPAAPQAQVASPSATFQPTSTQSPTALPTLTMTTTSLPTSTATFFPTSTPWPTETVTAVPPTPSHTPLPPTITPTHAATNLVYPDVVLYGYVMRPDSFQVGSYDAPISIADVELEGATELITVELATLVEGDIFVRLQGDYYPQEDGMGRLVVESIELVNFPFGPDTPLDATFRSQEAGFQFNYPAGWKVTTVERDDGRVGVRLHNAPEGSINWRPGRAYGDPTEFLATVFRDDTPSVEAYILDRLELFKEQLDNYRPGDPLTIHISMISNGGAQIYGWCCGSDFVFPFADGVIVWRMNGGREQNALLYRIVETLQTMP